MYKLRGLPQPTGLRAVKLALEVPLRVILHAAIAAIVVCNPRMWNSLWFYAMASAGLAYINWLNVTSLLQTLRADGGSLRAAVTAAQRALA